MIAENSPLLSLGPGIHPSGVGIQVDLPYGRSILQVDLDTVYVNAFDLDT